MWNKVFQYKGDWTKLYSEDFTADEKKKITNSLERALGIAGFTVEKVWGDELKTGEAKSLSPR